MINAALAANPEHLAPITEEVVGDSAKCFKDSTCAPDGFHPKSYGLLSVEGKQTLAMLLNALGGTLASGQKQTSASI